MTRCALCEDAEKDCLSDKTCVKPDRFSRFPLFPVVTGKIRAGLRPRATACAALFTCQEKSDFSPQNVGGVSREKNHASPAGISCPPRGADRRSHKHLAVGGCARVASGHFAEQNALRAPLTAWEQPTLSDSLFPPPGGNGMPPGEGNWYLLRLDRDHVTSRSARAAPGSQRDGMRQGNRTGDYERRRRCVARGNRTEQLTAANARPSARATPPSKKLTIWKACPAVSMAESINSHFAW